MGVTIPATAVELVGGTGEGVPAIPVETGSIAIVGSGWTCGNGNRVPFGNGVGVSLGVEIGVGEGLLVEVGVGER